MEKSLLDYLKEIPDCRGQNGRRHPLWLILLIIIMGMMSGYWGYRQLGRFVERHRLALIQILKIQGARVPSYSTIRRVMMNLDYVELEKIFNLWSQQSCQISSAEWLSVDGKSLRNTVSNYETAEQSFLSCVSAFSQEKGLVLGVKYMSNKEESEISVVRQLLEVLDLTGVIFTFDALHCQKKTVEAIIDSQNHYLVKVKKNQPKLYEQIEKQVESEIAVKKYSHEEKTRNRLTLREVEVFEVPQNLDELWKNAGCVIRVKRSGIRGGEKVESLSYYLCSLSPKSRRLAQGIRGHWLIENRLHWVKDVILEEDISPQKAGFSSINLSLLKTWTLTLLRIQGFPSLKEAISLLGHNLKELLSFCT
jgi:predicted transposase YbfD/YdcC